MRLGSACGPSTSTASPSHLGVRWMRLLRTCNGLLLQAMHAWSTGRVYVDILGHDEEDRVPETYGGAFTRVRLAIGSSAWWAGSARGQTKELGVARPSAPRGGFHERTTSGNRAHGCGQGHGGQ